MNARTLFSLPSRSIAPDQGWNAIVDPTAAPHQWCLPRHGSGCTSPDSESDRYPTVAQVDVVGPSVVPRRAHRYWIQIGIHLAVPLRADRRSANEPDRANRTLTNSEVLDRSHFLVSSFDTRERTCCHSRAESIPHFPDRNVPWRRVSTGTHCSGRERIPFIHPPAIISCDPHAIASTLESSISSFRMGSSCTTLHQLILVDPAKGTYQTSLTLLSPCSALAAKRDEVPRKVKYSHP